MPSPLALPRDSRAGDMRAACKPVAATLAAAALTVATAAQAHGLGMSQLRMQLERSHIAGAWEVQLQDARAALGLDARRAGDDGWQDLRAHEAALKAYLIQKTALIGDGAPCTSDASAAPATFDRAQSQVLISFGATCPAPPARLVIDCDLLFELDPKNRAYYSVQDDRITHLGVFRNDERQAAIDVHYFHIASGFIEFAREGITHIWSGLDHVLFLITLLLPAPLARTIARWSPKTGLGPVIREALKVVTAFTVAHSLTLCLSFFGILTLPARWVEAGIALSVLAAAWNNLRPFLPGRAWVMAFGFGLLHGLGFAGALRNLSLPMHARALALAAFNVGVEVGQLAIVALILPLLYWASKRPAYPRLVMGAGSLAIAWLAALWTIERAFGLSLLSFS